MTPRELSREEAAAEARQRDELARDVTLAWHVANLAVAAYAGKLPALSTLLKRIEMSVPAGPMTVDQLTAAMQMIGIPGRPVSEAALQAWRRQQES